jgi:hypothetical protein
MTRKSVTGSKLRGKNTNILAALTRQLVPVTDFHPRLAVSRQKLVPK